MAHTITLGYQDDPANATNAIYSDYVELGDTNPATNGYGLTDYQIGQVYIDVEGVSVRDLTLQMEVTGSSHDVIFTRLRDIERYLERTRLYYQYLKGQFPGRAITTNRDAVAAILTFKALTSTNQVYWDVRDGSIAVNPPILGSELVNNIISVTVVLTVAAAARGEKVYLYNLVPMGDFAAPFSLTSIANYPTLTGGWTTTGSWNQNFVGSGGTDFSVSPLSKATLSTSTNSSTLTSPSVAVSAGNILRPQGRYFIDSPPMGGSTLKLQIWNGSVWADQQTLSFSGVLTGWQTVTGSTYTVAGGITLARLLFTSPGAGGVGIHLTGFAIYKLKTTLDRLPTTEYVTCGLRAGLPVFNVYGIQGDTPAPCILRVINLSATSQRVLSIGKSTFYTAQDNPVFDLDIRTSNTTGGASTGLFWDNLPSTDGAGGGALTSTYNANFTFMDTFNDGRTIDFFPRLYRAYMMYAANDSALITKVTFRIGSEVRNYSISVPQTYTGTGNAAVGDYRLFDLGDYLYPRLSSASAESIYSFEVDNGTSVVLTHSNSANRRTSVGGVILVSMTDAASYINLGVSGSGIGQNSILNITTEGAAPVFFLTLDGSNGPPTPLTNSPATLTGGNFKLTPDLTKLKSSTTYFNNTCNHFSILMLRDQSATNERVYTFNAQDTFNASMEYFPRYQYGFR